MEHHGKNCDHTNCTPGSSNKSVCQTLSEMDWERGLWSAAFDGDCKRVTDLIIKSKNSKQTVNTPDNSGYTALHYAARNGHVHVCKTLIQYGAYVNAQTKSGNATPLHKAAAAGKLATIKYLIGVGASVETQDVDGQTILHKAIENKRNDVIKYLLDAYPQLCDIRDGKGNCPTIPT